MIFQAINFIQGKLNLIPGVSAVAANIGEIMSSEAGIPGVNDENVIITLLNIEENRISRDPRNYQRDGVGIVLKNPAVHLNLTLLFTAFRRGVPYETSLQNLQAVIEFFQHQYVFDQADPDGLNAGIEKLILEMVNINMEQLNHLWSILGGRYQPSVVYKMRMIAIDSVSEEEGGLIEEIDLKFYSK